MVLLLEIDIVFKVSLYIKAYNVAEKDGRILKCFKILFQRY